jgi:hypothetical protein
MRLRLDCFYVKNPPPERRDFVRQQVKILPFGQMFLWFAAAGQRLAVIEIKPYRAIPFFRSTPVNCPQKF